jgi:hypothetical protein
VNRNFIICVEFKVRWVLCQLTRIFSELLLLPDCSIALMWQYLSICSVYPSVAGECCHKVLHACLAAMCVVTGWPVSHMYMFVTSESMNYVCVSIVLR